MVSRSDDEGVVDRNDKREGGVCGVKSWEDAA